MVHKIRLMATTYASLRKWAADAGLSAEQSLLDRFITPVAGVTATGRLTFKVKNFRTAKEVCDVVIGYVFGHPFQLHECSYMLHDAATATMVWWFGVVVGALASINEVNLGRARLALRWATVSRFNSRCRTLISVFNQPATQGQLSLPSFSVVFS